MVMPWYVVLLIVWNLFGGLALLILSVNRSFPGYPAEMLRYEWLYDEFNVNGFGCALLTILFNAMCPLYTVGYWFVRTFKYLCTVGRVDV